MSSKKEYMRKKAYEAYKRALQIESEADIYSVKSLIDRTIGLFFANIEAPHYVVKFRSHYPSGYHLEEYLKKELGYVPVLMQTDIDGDIANAIFVDEDTILFFGVLEGRERKRKHFVEEMVKDYKKEIEELDERVKSITDEELAQLASEKEEMGFYSVIGMEMLYVVIAGKRDAVYERYKQIYRFYDLRVPRFTHVYFAGDKIAQKEKPLILMRRPFIIKNPAEELIYFYPWLKDYGYENIDDFARDYIESGEPLLFLYGPAGTGKTWFAQWLYRRIFEMEKSWSLYIVAPDVWRVGPGMLFYSLDVRRAIIMSDEIERVFGADDTSEKTPLQAVLLQETGLYNPYLKLIFTVNTSEGFHEALLRSGRTFMGISAREFTNEEAEEFLKRYDPKKRSLSEFYEKFDVPNIANLTKFISQGFHRVKLPKKKVGFITSR